MQRRSRTPPGGLIIPFLRLHRKPSRPHRLRVVTGNGPQPFSDDSLPMDGMLARIASTAFKQGTSLHNADVFRINDWRAHLSPLLEENLMDISDPGPKPDCSGAASRDLCARFAFSDPLFEILMLLFVEANRTAATSGAGRLF